jgi:radical SAM superfamily enzyme YgiQ (UPF0313 family)
MTSIYLADLRYNYSGVLANDCTPLGVAYMKAVMDRDLPEVRSRLFAYPDRLERTLKDEPPDVLMLSNYMWNEALSLQFARIAKRIRPDTLVVMGGPNIALEPARQIEFFERHRQLDLYVLGEGDFLAAEVVRHFLDSGKSIAKLGDREIPSSLYRRPDGQTVRTEMWARENKIDEIPSPWTTGIQDEFFDGKLSPLMETNRGCPFTCTFCVQGINWYTKVHNFSIDRIKEELEYVARRVSELCPSMGTLRIADSNYGMFERDVEISGHLGLMQKKYNYPLYIDATTGKNRADRIIKSVEAVNGALVLYQAVQSLDETVLKNVKRSTIKLDAYEKILIHVRGRGLRSNSDLILGMPGETLETHKNGIYKLLDAGVSQVTNFQLMMLSGSELDTVESRKKFNFDTRFRVLPKNFGEYGGERIIDVDEIVVATDTMSFDDYLKARRYALASVAFWHDDALEDALQFASKLGVKRSEWLDGVLRAMETDEGEVREFLDQFTEETKGELFPTREACVEFYTRPENFDRMHRGEIGDNLMHKYHAIAVLHIWPAICRLGMDVTRKLLVAKGAQQQIPDFDGFWHDFHLFMELKHATGRTVEEVLAPRRATLSYDIATWLLAGAPVDPSAFRMDMPAPFEFKLPAESADALRKAFEVWTTQILGLSKLITRIQFQWQVRRCERLPSKAALASTSLGLADLGAPAEPVVERPQLSS